MKEKKDIADAIIRQLSDSEGFGDRIDCGDGYGVRIDYEPADSPDRDHVVGIYAHVYSEGDDKNSISIEERLFEYPEDDDSQDPSEFAEKYFGRASDYFYYLCDVVDMLAEDILTTIEEDKKWL